MKKLWFRAKTYGWGWTPSTWQGWVVILAYLVLVYGGLWVGVRYLPEDKQVVLFFPYIALLTALVFWISFTKGEKPRWRWGDDTKDKK